MRRQQQQKNTSLHQSFDESLGMHADRKPTGDWKDAAVDKIIEERSKRDQVFLEFFKNEGDGNFVLLPSGARAHIFWIALEGPIGAGKSTLLSSLMSMLEDEFGKDRVYVVQENVESMMEDGLFGKFQRKPAKYALEFQIKVFDDRTNDFLAEYDRILKLVDQTSVKQDEAFPYKRVFLFTERSILSDGIFMKCLHDGGLVKKRTFDNYCRWNKKWRLLYAIRPSLVVYCLPGATIEEAIDNCQSRILERARPGEEFLVTKEYNGNLLAQHEAVFRNPGNRTGGKQFAGFDFPAGLGKAFRVPVVTINTLENYRDDKDVALKRSAEMIDHINSHSPFSFHREDAEDENDILSSSPPPPLEDDYDDGDDEYSVYCLSSSFPGDMVTAKN